MRRDEQRIEHFEVFANEACGIVGAALLDERHQAIDEVVKTHRNLANGCELRSERSHRVEERIGQPHRGPHRRRLHERSIELELPRADHDGVTHVRVERCDNLAHGLKRGRCGVLRGPVVLTRMRAIAVCRRAQDDHGRERVIEQPSRGTRATTSSCLRCGSRGRARPSLCAARRCQCPEMRERFAERASRTPELVESAVSGGRRRPGG